MKDRQDFDHMQCILRLFWRKDCPRDHSLYDLRITQRTNCASFIVLKNAAIDLTIFAQAGAWVKY